MARTVAAKPQNDVYFGMLVTVLVAMVIGILCTVLELGDYETAKPPASGLPKADALRAEMKPLASEQGALLPPQPEKPAVAVATPAPTPAVQPTTPPATLPQLPAVAANPAPASGPTPSPVNVPLPTPLASPPASSPTPSPLVIPPPLPRR